MSEIHELSFGPVFGHKDVKAQLLESIKTGRTHHGWMFNGPRGVGKFRTALQFAAALLSSKISDFTKHTDEHVVHLMLQNSHPDFRVIQRPFDDKGKQKSEIPVSSIRELSKFFSLKPAMGGWRIAIIDSLDEMNRNGENALLKTLEEPPPQSLIILIVHGETPVLPTIRSRCRTLRFGILDMADSTQALIAAGMKVADARDALSFALGRPGKAMSMCSTDARLAARSAKKAATQRGTLEFQGLSEMLTSGSKSQESFDAAFSSLCSVVYEAARQADHPIVAGEWAQTHENLIAISQETKLLNQDKSQAIASAIFQIQRMRRMVGQ